MKNVNVKNTVNPSIAEQVKTMLENSSFNDEQLERLKQLMDFDINKVRTKIAYQLLKPIEDDADRDFVKFLLILGFLMK